MKKVNDTDILEIKKQVDVAWLPSPSQRACKAKFWKRADYLLPEDHITLAQAVQVTGNSSLQTWWSLEGFKEWFCNKDEANERIEYLYMLWMDKAEELLLNPEANHNAIVQIGKIIAQLSGRGDNNTERYLDDMVQNMNKQQLKEYIKKHAPRLVSEEPSQGVIDGTAGTLEKI